MIKKYVITVGTLVILGISSMNAFAISNSDLLDCEEQCDNLFSKLKKYASHGSPHAQTLLALAFKTGEGVEVDNDSAWRWIRRAHRQAFPPALHTASKWFRQGFATEVDIEEADALLQRAADQNFGPAILDLGILHYHRNNEVLALELINKAAKMGSEKAKLFLNQKKVSDMKKNQRPNEAITQVEQVDSENMDRDIENDGEILTIVGNRQDPITLLNNVLAGISDSGYYDTKGTTGSRLTDRKCTGDAKGFMDCKVVYSRQDKNKTIY